MKVQYTTMIDNNTMRYIDAVQIQIRNSIRTIDIRAIGDGPREFTSIKFDDLIYLAIDNEPVSIKR